MFELEMRAGFWGSLRCPAYLDEGFKHPLCFRARPVAQLGKADGGNCFLGRLHRVSNDAQSNSFGIRLGFFLGIAVRKGAWEFWNIRDPAPVIFAIKFYMEIHRFPPLGHRIRCKVSSQDA
jgi:hypothetical protein